MRARMHSSILRLSIQIRTFFFYSVSSFLLLFCLLHHYQLMVHGWKQKKSKMRSWKLGHEKLEQLGSVWKAKKITEKKSFDIFSDFCFTSVDLGNSLMVINLVNSVENVGSHEKKEKESCFSKKKGGNPRETTFWWFCTIVLLETAFHTFFK